ncbi:hypothetical protein PG985_012129 [Apiospora marii]|uniref:uncharacterized protein n=1 Tax=Apiospora marii TaxID=335849 RepID=UPI003132178F
MRDPTGPWIPSANVGSCESPGIRCGADPLPAFIAVFFGSTAGFGAMGVKKLTKNFADHDDVMEFRILDRN